MEQEVPGGRAHPRVIITLCMIVKNEEAILGRCLHEARRLYDRYVIVDTGSADRTEDAAREALEGVEGTFVRLPWKGFGRSKTDALDLARDTFGTAPDHYALVLDADEIVQGGWPSDLGKYDRYGLWMQTSAHFRYPNHRLFRMSIPWKYVGVRHEFPIASNGQPFSETLLAGMSITTPRDGARGKDPNVYANDAQEIVAELARGDFELPGLDTRYRFYLAQSYRDAKNLEAAILNYRLRAAMGGGLNYEEVYISHLEAGRALSRLGRHHESQQAFLDAHHAAPHRAEAVRELAVRFEEARKTRDVSPPAGVLFVETAPDQPLSPLPHRDGYALLKQPLSDNRVRKLEARPGTLADLFYDHAGLPIDKWHHYLAVYERHLQRFTPEGRGIAGVISRPPRVLEIGVQRGGSLQLWRKWFGSEATIRGLDIDPSCARHAEEPTIIHVGSQTDTKLLKRIVKEMGGLDVVIEDGSHINEDQIITLETLYPLLSPHGVYICEDVHSSYWSAYYGGGWRKKGSFIEHIKDHVDYLHAWYAEGAIDPDEYFARTTRGIHIYDSIVVLEKEPKGGPQRSVVGLLQSKTEATTSEASGASAVTSADEEEVADHV